MPEVSTATMPRMRAEHTACEAVHGACQSNRLSEWPSLFLPSCSSAGRPVGARSRDMIPGRDTLAGHSVYCRTNGGSPNRTQTNAEVAALDICCVYVSRLASTRSSLPLVDPERRKSIDPQRRHSARKQG